MRILIIIAVFVFAGFIIYTGLGNLDRQTSQKIADTPSHLHPLSIEYLRQQEYPGSEIVIDQTLNPGSNYKRYIASYKSEGLKIYALLTVPNGDQNSKYPVVVFNHGYIPPLEYSTTERYAAYTDVFSRNGYIVFKPDYRGHGNSEGQAAGGYGSNAYTIDVLNAVSSIKRLKDPKLYSSSDPAKQESREVSSENSSRQARTVISIVDPNRIGMWGHSMGGSITLRSMVASKDIKAGVIWAGVVASYPDLLNRWRRRVPPITPLPGNTRGSWRQSLIDQYGSAEENPTFWNSISPNSYLSEISGPLQLHHGTADASVPIEFSEKLYDQLKTAGKEAELYIYQGDDHNISTNFGTAMQRSVEFFDKYLK
jgi:dipeptidyl aminopeptidase/acylaminoacyl peptidase